MRTFKVNLTNIEHLQTIVVQAETEAEAVEQAKQVFEDGNAYVYSNELVVDEVYKKQTIVLSK